MRERLPMELHEQARDLYIFDGLSYSQIHKLLNISVPTLSKWAQDESWPQERIDQRLIKYQTKNNLIKLRRKLIQMALDDTTPQNIYALSSFLKAVGDKLEAETYIDINQLCDSPQSAIELIENSLYKLVSALSLHPERINPEKLQQVHSSFEVIAGLKEKYGMRSSGKERRITEEEIERIEIEYLGLQKA